jgi:hypothetical protein
MLNEKEVDRLNNFLKGKTFPYKRGIFDYDLPGENDFDFKFQILGYKKMISVGEYYDYTIVSVTLLNFRDELSQMLFLRRLNGDFLKKYFKENMYYFRNNLNTEIRDILKVFDEDARVTIQDIEIETPESKESLQEQKMIRKPLREIVQIIVNLFKDNDEGNFVLPEDVDPNEMVYDIEKVGSPFSIELIIEPNEDIKTVMVDGNFWGDDDTIEITIQYNPKDKKRIMYDLVGKVNETLAHELRHLIQKNRGIFDLDGPEEEDPYKYYTQPHELDALKFGFKRLAKLRKLPLEIVIKDWFNNHKEIHRLKNNQISDVVSKIVNYN